MTRGAFAAVAAAAAIGGCGGGSEESESDAPPPKPKESISAFAGRLASAIEAGEQGKCASLRALSEKGGLQLPCGDEARTAFRGFKVTATATYGTGGVVEFVGAETEDPELPPGVEESEDGARGIYTVAVDPSGHYAFTGPFAPILPGPTVGTRAASFAGADAAAREFVDAVRRRDCRNFYRVTLTPGLEQEAACSRTLGGDYAPLTKQLRKHEKATVVRSGGTAHVAFYGLRTGDEYRTLVVLRNAPGEEQPYLVMGAFRGPSS